MKKYILFYSVLLLYGCSQSYEQEAISELELKKIESVLLMKGNEQRLAFDLLGVQSKRSLWLRSLRSKLVSRKFDREQTMLINELVKTVSSSTFTDQVQLISFREKWLDKAKKRFSNIEIFEIAHTPGLVVSR